MEGADRYLNISLCFLAAPRDIIKNIIYEKLLSSVGFSAQIFNNSLDTRYRISRADFRKG